eukprot:COSAG02_NODE_60783_length_270_cov_0.859649_1_plen_26_part_10
MVTYYKPNKVSKTPTIIAVHLLELVM